MDEISIGMGHEILDVLLNFNRMAGGTVRRGDDGVDFEAIVFEGIFMLFRIHGVAFGAADHGFQQEIGNFLIRNPSFQLVLLQGFGRQDMAMAALLPFGYDSRMERGVACQAGLCILTYGGFRLSEPCPRDEKNRESNQT
jgi:hypothetical protein